MPRIAVILMGFFVVCFAVACGGGSRNPDTASSISGSNIATATVAVASADEKPTAAPTPDAAAITVANEPIAVEAADGVVLQGHLYSPNGPKRQALIIVAPVEQSTWAESTAAFTSEGIAVFTFDPRGFGETGGEENPDALAGDAQLVTRFVMSREYPLVYLFGVGVDGGAAVSEAASSLDGLAGVVTYGAPRGDNASNTLSLGGDSTWNGEDVLGIPEVRDAVLSFVLGAN